MRFVFTKSVYDLGVRGVYYNMRLMRNVQSTDSRVRAFVERQLSSVPNEMETSDTLRGFSELHAAISGRAAKLVASRIALLALFRAKKDIPRINGTVDVYNAVSVASGLAIGAHDLAHVDGDIELRLTHGGETFWPLGALNSVRVPAGEYAYVDASNEILCRLEVRQVEKTKIGLDSRDVFFIVQGHHGVDVASMQRTGEILGNGLPGPLRRANRAAVSVGSESKSPILARSCPCARRYFVGRQPKPFGAFLTHKRHPWLWIAATQKS
jgi:DNA/RNA-binding domain of Phe-tRNA-synthetase-like protein